MSKQRIAFTPRQVSRDPDRPVARRILFYLPGYDPDGERRYRTLFLREIRRYARVFGVPFPCISRPVASADGLSQSWTVVAEDGAGRTRTEYDVLLWSDLVRRDMARSHWVGAGLNAVAIAQAAMDGTLLRLYRANWKCANVLVYPFVMSLVLLVGLLLFAALGHGILGYDHFGVGLALPVWLPLLIGGIAGLVGLRFLAPRLDRAFLWQLMHDWVFHRQHARGRRPDYRARLDAFADHALARIRHGDYDEILLVGHSTGGLAAVELVDRMLAKDPRLGREGPVLSLLTIGSCLAIVALQPGADDTRAEIARLVACPRLDWVDFQAPQDWMNFPGFLPSRDLPLGLSEAEVLNPIVRSAKFKEIIDGEIYRQIKLRPFRMHFQFLMANDRAGVFDIFALTLGRRTLRTRVLGDHSDPLGPG
jgi:pimeloyl-ACP methyl ester carboxylesterase